MSETFAVIAGGGTAGHVNPGLALAAELVARGHVADTIVWVGSERRLEVTLVPPTGHPLLVAGRGVQRRLTVANIGALWGLFVALRPRVRPGASTAVPRRRRARWVCERPVRVRGMGVSACRSS